MERADTAAEEVMDDEYARDVAFSVIFQGHGEVSIACVITHQDDMRGMWRFLHQQYGANKTFSKAALHSALAQTRCNGPTMQNYVKRWEQVSTQVTPKNASIYEHPLVTVFVESFGGRSDLTFRSTFIALLTAQDFTWQPATSRLLQEFAWHKG